MNPRGEITGRLRSSLPYALTAAQERVWSEIRQDMAASYQHWKRAAEIAWTWTVTASDESTTENSSAAMHMLRRSAPEPP